MHLATSRGEKKVIFLDDLDTSLGSAAPSLGVLGGCLLSLV